MKEEAFRDLLPRFTKGNAIALFCPVNKLYRRRLLCQNHISWNENITFQEDLMFVVTVLACAETLSYVPGAYYHYIQQAGGLCSTYRQMAGRQFIYARNEFDRLIEKYGMVNIDYATFNSAYIYNIGYYVYRTLYNVKDKQKKQQLIADVLTDDLTVRICENLSNSGASFDKRIATAIVKRNFKIAIMLIKFVYSGRAAKLQRFLARIRNCK